MLQYCCNILCWRNGSATFCSATTNCGCSRMWEPPLPINHFLLPNDSHPLSAGMERSMFESIKHTFWQLWGEEKWLPFWWSALINTHVRLWGAVNDDWIRFCWQISAKKKKKMNTTRLTEIYNSFWRNSIHFGSSATFVFEPAVSAPSLNTNGGFFLPPPLSRQITSFKRIWQCIKCSAGDTYVRADGEISLQQMLIRISAAALPLLPGVFSSRENNKLLGGRLRAEAEGHLSLMEYTERECHRCRAHKRWGRNVELGCQPGAAQQDGSMWPFNPLIKTEQGIIEMWLVIMRVNTFVFRFRGVWKSWCSMIIFKPD